MRDLIRSEWRKIRTTRSAWGLLAGAVFFAGIAAWAMVATSHVGAAVALSTLPGFAEAMIIVPIFVVVLGIRSYSDEARHGSIVPTLLASPNRRRVVAAKAVVLTLMAVVFAIAASAMVAAVSLILLTVQGTAITLHAGALAVLVGKAVLICVLWAVLGLGVGLAVPYQVAAIVGAILLPLVAEGLVELLSVGVAKVLPGHASSALLGIGGADASLVAPLVGGILLGAWALGSVVVGSAALVRRDMA
jgi:hypothetical protein